MKELLRYGERFIGVKYTLWTGDEQSTNQTPYPFYIDSIPSIEYAKKYGMNCAGFINILRLRTGKSIPGEGKWRGGTESWYNYLNNNNLLTSFDYRINYPIGTLLVRKYRGVCDQGHVAVIHSKSEDKYLDDTIIHSYNESSGGKVGISSLGYSHYSIPGGFYEYISLPNDWLYK